MNVEKHAFPVYCLILAFISDLISKCSASNNSTDDVTAIFCLESVKFNITN